MQNTPLVVLIIVLFLMCAGLLAWTNQPMPEMGILLVEFEKPLESANPEEPTGEDACEDICGDSICQEIVCMAVGCPCVETADSCPIDCGAQDGAGLQVQ